GMPTSIEGLRGHTLLGFTQPEHLNRWPVVHADGDRLEIQPDISASSGETLRQLALSHQGIACLASFMTDRDIQDGRLVPLFAEQMSEYRQPIHAVYYRNSQLALRIQCFLDFIQQRLGA
ncbi:TPA: LysR family transcriptional regulator, partial [Pseudomonas aeruginosa]|nr:LysR family transcriptional regulator [Pseudomonas aeruginosa]